MKWRTRLFEQVIMPTGDFCFQQRVSRFLKYYRNAARWPREELYKERDRLVQQTVVTAYREVPFYRDLYDEHAVDIGSIRGYDDLELLPYVTKDMLRDAEPNSLRRNTRFRAHSYSTSGSTGRPFQIVVDDDSMSRARALMFLRSYFAGYEVGMPLLHFGGSPRRGRMNSLKDWLFQIYYRSSYSLSDKDLDESLDLMEKSDIQHIAGHGQSIHLLAQRAINTGRQRQIRSIITWGSQILDVYRDHIQQAFSCNLIDSYGIAEGIQIAAQCEQHNPRGYHQFVLHSAVEICQDEHRVASGEIGEVVVTRLDPGTVPLIRYRVGDLSSLCGDQQCSCGRTYPLMGPILGRTSDIILTPRHKRLILHFFTALFGEVKGIDQFQVNQNDEHAIHIDIVPNRHFTADDMRFIEREIKERGDPDLKIEFSQVADIPFEKSGKRKFINSPFRW